jgi:hypothetical protein
MLRQLIRKILAEAGNVYTQVSFYRDEDGRMMWKDDMGKSGMAHPSAPEGETLPIFQASVYFEEDEGSRFYNRNFYRPNRGY